MMSEGKNDDFALSGKKDDVVRKPSQNKPFDAGLAQRPRDRHRWCGPRFKKVEARVKGALEPASQPRALRLIPVDRRLRFVRGGRMDTNNRHWRLSEAPLQPVA